MLWLFLVEELGVMIIFLLSTFTTVMIIIWLLVLVLNFPAIPHKAYFKRVNYTFDCKVEWSKVYPVKSSWKWVHFLLEPVQIPLHFHFQSRSCETGFISKNSVKLFRKMVSFLVSKTITFNSKLFDTMRVIKFVNEI